MTTTRLTIDILAAAPHAPTIGRTAILRDGKRIQLVQSELVVDDRVVARATALRTRITETPAFEDANPYPPPETVPSSDFMGTRAFGGTLETRLVAGGLRIAGPGTLWVRFGHEHVAGVPLSPLLRTAILGDFGGGLGSVVTALAGVRTTVHASDIGSGERAMGTEGLGWVAYGEDGGAFGKQAAPGQADGREGRRAAS